MWQNSYSWAFSTILVSSQYLYQHPMLIVMLHPYLLYHGYIHIVKKNNVWLLSSRFLVWPYILNLTCYLPRWTLPLRFYLLNSTHMLFRFSYCRLKVMITSLLYNLSSAGVGRKNWSSCRRVWAIHFTSVVCRRMWTIAVEALEYFCFTLLDFMRPFTSSTMRIFPAEAGWVEPPASLTFLNRSAVFEGHR